jgi:hypothetical protein
MLELREKAEEVLESYGIDTSKYHVGILSKRSNKFCLLDTCGKRILDFRVKVESKLTRSSRKYLINKIMPNILDKYKDEVLEAIELRELIPTYKEPTKPFEDMSVLHTREGVLLKMRMFNDTTEKHRVTVELLYIPELKTLELYLYNAHYAVKGDSDYESTDIVKRISKYIKDKALLKYCEELTAGDALARRHDELMKKLTTCII